MDKTLKKITKTSLKPTEVNRIKLGIRKNKITLFAGILLDKKTNIIIAISLLVKARDVTVK